MYVHIYTHTCIPTINECPSILRWPAFTFSNIKLFEEKKIDRISVSGCRHFMSLSIVFSTKK